MNIAVDTPSVPETVYLKDYMPPAFAVNSIDLDIRVFDTYSEVTAKLDMRRQHAGDLVLLGRDLELKSIRINGQQLSPEQYQLDSEQLTIANVSDQAIVETVVIIHPELNTQLEGLYKAGGDLFVTQNEPEGFRKITF